jgi:hypothetical protein
MVKSTGPNTWKLFEDEKGREYYIDIINGSPHKIDPTTNEAFYNYGPDSQYSMKSYIEHGLWVTLLDLK